MIQYILEMGGTIYLRFFLTMFIFYAGQNNNTQHFQDKLSRYFIVHIFFYYILSNIGTGTGAHIIFLK